MPVLVPDMMLASLTPVAPSSFPKWKPYMPNNQKGRAISDTIRELITRPLKKEEVDLEGYINVFQKHGVMGRLKIGRPVHVGNRVQQWSDRCNQIIQKVFRSETAEVHGIPHISRVEKLIHAELKECRPEHYCSECEKVHREWFETSGDLDSGVVVRVVEKWLKWMKDFADKNENQTPYTKQTLQDGQDCWVLREEARVNLESLCRPYGKPADALGLKQTRHNPTLRDSFSALTICDVNGFLFETQNAGTKLW